jgi:TonB family protein
VSTSTHTQPSKATAAPAPARGTYALQPAPLLALTQDAKFLAMLKRVSAAGHPVRAVGSEIDFAAAQLTQQAAVAVLDSAAIATSIEQLTARLHAQFPDLVLIVAGSAEEQGLLAAQITDGSVHRFLHKPLSEQRVRLFVEAAWRRHQEGMQGAATPAAAPPRRMRWAPILAVLLALGALGAWLASTTQRSPAPVAHAPAPMHSEDEAALEELLVRAEAALAAGALTAPANPNAADLYREALRRSARDPRAVSGLEQVIDRLLSDADAQLQEHHLDAAQQLAEQARAISPGHARVAFLLAQIGAQRERAVLGRAQRAAAGGDVNAALAVLDDAARAGHRAGLVDEARAQLAQQQVDARVADFLTRAREALEHGALIEPPEQNARFYVESAQTLAPRDAQVQQVHQELLARLESESRQAATAGNADLADRLADAAAEGGAEAAEIGVLHQAAQQVRGAAHADAITKSETLFKERLAQGRLLEPASDSAKFYLEQLAQAEPAGAATLAARTAFEARLLDEARTAAQAHDAAHARQWLNAATAAGASASGIAAIEAELAPAAAAPAAGTNTDFINPSTLTRTHYVAPVYPVGARTKGIEGWVDVQFRINTDGTVAEASIVGAQPVGIFEPSALDAVRRWRYEPVLRAGLVRVRLRFAVQS